MQHILRLVVGFLPHWLVPVPFLAAVVLGREEMAVVANSASWSHLHAIIMAAVGYTCYTFMLVLLSRRVPWLRRKIDGLSGSKLIAKLLRRADTLPIGVQYVAVLAIAFVPTVGFGGGVVWARRGSRSEQLRRIPAVIVGATVSYLCYNSLVAWLMALPLTVGSIVLAVLAMLVVGFHYRHRLPSQSFRGHPVARPF